MSRVALCENPVPGSKIMNIPLWGKHNSKSHIDNRGEFHYIDYRILRIAESQNGRNRKKFFPLTKSEPGDRAGSLNDCLEENNGHS
jgi:hypothetical protein